MADLKSQLAGLKGKVREAEEVPRTEGTLQGFYVARHAVRRVKDKLPIPTTCSHCQGKVELVSNSRIYAGREYGKWPFAYLCLGCGAYVGVHPETDIPLGTLATAEMRTARNKAKESFNMLWECEYMTRNAAYRWLAEQMGIPPEQCHFGWFDVETCAKAEQFCLEKFDEFFRKEYGLNDDD